MTVNPPDALVAARSFPRRWRALFATAGADPDDTGLLERSGAPALADEAADVLDATAGRLQGGLPAGTGAGLDRLEGAALHLAAAIETVPSDDWAGARIQALTNGIDAVAGLLRRAEQAIDAARADRAG